MGPCTSTISSMRCFTRSQDCVACGTWSYVAAQTVWPGLSGSRVQPFPGTLLRPPGQCGVSALHPWAMALSRTRHSDSHRLCDLGDGGT